MFNEVAGGYEDYLRDESRRTGRAAAISFPGCEADLISDIRQAAENGTPITIQGARTGITAGAVPEEGYIINLSHMNGITGLRYEPRDDCFYITVEPGLLLCDLRKALEEESFDTTCWSDESKEALKLIKEKGPYFFPPDPTETTASLGGMAACNASGARTFYYGPVRRYIHSLRVVLADGSVVTFTRGVECAEDGHFSVNAISGSLPDYRSPEVKNAAGYYVESSMDLLDLIIGSEGTLGVISSLELKLLKLPEAMYGLMAFFTGEASAVNYVKCIRDGLAGKKAINNAVGSSAIGNNTIDSIARLAAIEYFNENAIKLLKKQKESNPAFSELPEVNESFRTAVYIEVHGTEADASEQLMTAAEILEECGGNADDTWIAMDGKEMERLKYFRHTVPEAVNLEIDLIKKKHPQVAKLGTDMSVPDSSLDAVLDMYNTDLQAEGLQSVIFGHIGDNHLHVNIIPQNDEEYQRGQALYKKWAQRVVSMGGSVSAEHGVGKIKTEMLKIMYGEKGVQQMKDLKTLFDRQFRLNRGNLFR